MLKVKSPSCAYGEIKGERVKDGGLGVGKVQKERENETVRLLPHMKLRETGKK